MDHIVYRDGYKYQLLFDYKVQTGIETGLPSPVGNDWVKLHPDGTLAISRGYAWDGPSGPAIDTPDFMRGSLIHDALYQLMREGFLSKDLRQKADELLVKICREDGMSWIRSQWVYLAVRKFGGEALTPKPPKVAP